jgi:hypothetical protein
MIKGITIDPSHALDLDDAIWVDSLPGGGWRAQVSIANVARAVRPGSPEDLDARARDLDRSVIARIPLSTLTIAATGNIPGHLLNQFSLDEHQGNLRVAVTVGDQWGMGGGDGEVDRLSDEARNVLLGPGRLRGYALHLVRRSLSGGR